MSAVLTPADCAAMLTGWAMTAAPAAADAPKKWRRESSGRDMNPLSAAIPAYGPAAGIRLSQFWVSRQSGFHQDSLSKASRHAKSYCPLI